MFRPKRAIELLTLCGAADTLTDLTRLAPRGTVVGGVLNPGVDCTIDGLKVTDPTIVSDRNAKADTESFVARTTKHVVVAFRSSETRLFDRSGALRDWLLTDLRANRIVYEPAPGAWPNRRWVHAGFFQAWSLVRLRVLAAVGRAAGSGAERVHVTGFSLGGALAYLAALDIAAAMPDTPVQLHSFGAPRVGDGGLNNLLRSRLEDSYIVGYRSDPTPHVPPIGPNFPVNFRHPIKLTIGGINIPLGNPALPQIGQQYRSAEHIVWLDGEGGWSCRWPIGRLSLSPWDHTLAKYHAALRSLPGATAGTTAPSRTTATRSRRNGRGEAALRMMLAS